MSALHKAWSIEDIIRESGEGLQMPEEQRAQRTQGGLLFDGFEKLLEKYERALELEKEVSVLYQDIRKIGLPALLPEQINAFLQSTITYEAHKNYSLNTGMFATALMQESYNAGNNGFLLCTKGLMPLHYLGAWLEGKKKRQIEVIVDGDAGDYCGYDANSSIFSIGGDAGYGCGLYAKSSGFSIGGDAGYWCGLYAKSSAFSIGGDAGDWCGDSAESSIFKTSNMAALEMLKRYVAKARKNKIYFIHPDRREELAWQE